MKIASLGAVSASFGALLVAGAAAGQIADFQTTPVDTPAAASQEAVDAFGSVLIVDPTNVALGKVDYETGHTRRFRSRPTSTRGSTTSRRRRTARSGMRTMRIRSSAGFRPTASSSATECRTTRTSSPARRTAASSSTR